MQIDLKALTPVERQHYLQSAVAPRPICFASTIDGEGRVNLSPFSFFNLFGTTPPILIFSPSRRVRDNSTKHTWHNIQEVPEVVINIVDLPMVQQIEAVLGEKIPRCTVAGVEPWVEMEKPAARRRTRV